HVEHVDEPARHLRDGREEHQAIPGGRLTHISHTPGSGRGTRLAGQGSGRDGTSLGISWGRGSERRTAPRKVLLAWDDTGGSRSYSNAGRFGLQGLQPTMVLSPRA